MSRAQGPCAKRGDATVANVAGRRQFGVSVMFDLSEAAGMSREQATAQRGARAPLGVRPLRGMQAPPLRSLASAPPPDPAGAGPSGYAPASTREAGMQASANTAGRRRHRVLVWFGLTEAAGMSRVLRWRT